MSLLLTLPDWLPWWIPLALLLPALLYAVAFFLMPFSVLGVKTRLESMEARLEEIQTELRVLGLRLPAGAFDPDFEETYARPPAAQPGPTLSAPSSDPAPEPTPHHPPLTRGRGPSIYPEDDETYDLPAPPPDMRPIRRADPIIRRAPQRTEPRFDRPR